MSATDGRVVVTRRVVTPRQVLLVASLGAMLAFIDATIVNVAFPDIRRDFEDASLASISWVLNAYNIVFAAFIVAAGRIADLLGRKKLFEVGIYVFTLASALCAIAPSVELLVAARVLQAIGAAIMVPASLALVLEGFPAAERAHGVALWTAVAALAAGLGPSLGGVLVELDGWRLAFLVNLPIGLFAVWASKHYLVESRAPGRRTLPDLNGALLLAAATGTLTLGIVKGQDWGWTSPETLLSFGAALLLGAAFAERCTWHRSPMIDLSLLRIRSLAVSNAVSIVAAAGFYAYVLCNVLFLTTVWGYSVLEAGLAITPGPFIAAAVARPAEALAHRIGERFTIAIGALFWAAGVLYMAQVVGLQPDFVGEWLPGMAILGIGAGITFPVVGSTAVAEITGGRFATATGINSIARQLGAVLGVALLVAIVGTPSPAEVGEAFDRGWLFAAACFAVVAAGALALGRVNHAGDAESAAEADRQARARAREEAEAERPRPVTPPPAPPAAKRTPAEFLGGVPMFSGLPEETLERMAARAETVHVQAGEWLFRQGDAADAVYVVVSGRVDVLLEDPDPQLLRVLGPEAVVGELALLAESTRSASIRARRDSELLRLTRAEFDSLVAEDARFTTQLLRLMGEQLQRSRALEPPGTSASSPILALVGSRPELEAYDVAACVVEALGGPGSVAHLDGPSREPFDPAAEAEMLERYERDYDHVLLVAGAEGDWLDFCLRHADRTALLATGAPGSRPLERYPLLQGCDLLLAGEALRHAGGWLDAVSPRAHHVLEQGGLRGASVARAARRLAGRSVGVVLSGGGARAFAHIGVLEELRAAGIEVDRVGGCSMGAFIGAMHALGMDPEEIDARCYEEWVRQSPLNDYRIPRHSLIRGDKVSAMIHRTLPGEIETLPRDYFCVSGDLITGELVVHRRGNLGTAVGTSMSLPGLVAPSVVGDYMLVDGGVLNNLPVDVMAATGEGPVIAVDVTARFERPVADASTNGRSPRFRRRRKEAAEAEVLLPSFGEALTRALMLGSTDTAEAARRHADLVITPHNEDVGMLEFHQLDRVREEGRRAAAEALRQAPAEIVA